MMKEQQGVLGLAAVRRNRGLSLQQISEATKISVRCLEAIEGVDFCKLPGGIYTTSYIRQYARAIDYDEDTILECYRSQTGGPSSPATSDKKDNNYNGLRPASTPVRP